MLTLLATLSKACWRGSKTTRTAVRLMMLYTTWLEAERRRWGFERRLTEAEYPLRYNWIKSRGIKAMNPLSDMTANP